MEREAKDVWCRIDAISSLSQLADLYYQNPAVSFLVEQDLRLEHELGIVADFILLAEVYLVRLFSVIEQKTRIRIDEDFCN